MPTLSITFTPEQAQRVADAFGYALGLGTAATEADVKQYIINDLKQIIRNAEKRIAIDQIAALPDVDLT